MVVGVMQAEIAIPWSRSLKDKRRVVRSLRDALHRHHMVSVSEVEDHEILTRASLGVAIVGVSGGAIGATLDRVLERIRSVPECELTHTSRQVHHGWGASFSAATRDRDEHEEDPGALRSELLARGQEQMERETA